MGVQGLWSLISPAGKKIDPENLRGQRLAIDVSIWVMKIIYGYIAKQNPNQQNFQHIHLIMIFKRLVALLHMGVKPVFVFDGKAPELKKQTLMIRQQLRENREKNLKKLAEKYLVKQLENRLTRNNSDNINIKKDPLQKEIQYQKEKEQYEQELEEIQDLIEGLNQDDKTQFDVQLEIHQHAILDTEFEQIFEQNPTLLDQFGITHEEFLKLAISDKNNVLQDMIQRQKRLKQQNYQKVKDMDEYSRMQAQDYVQHCINQQKLNQIREKNYKTLHDLQLEQMKDRQNNQDMVDKLLNQPNAKVLQGDVKSNRDHFFLFIGEQQQQQQQQNQEQKQTGFSYNKPRVTQQQKYKNMQSKMNNLLQGRQKEQYEMITMEMNQKKQDEEIHLQKIKEDQDKEEENKRKKEGQRKKLEDIRAENNKGASLITGVQDYYDDFFGDEDDENEESQVENQPQNLIVSQKEEENQCQQSQSLQNNDFDDPFALFGQDQEVNELFDQQDIQDQNSQQNSQKMEEIEGNKDIQDQQQKFKDRLKQQYDSDDFLINVVQESEKKRKNSQNQNKNNIIFEDEEEEEEEKQMNTLIRPQSGNYYQKMDIESEQQKEIDEPIQYTQIFSQQQNSNQQANVEQVRNTEQENQKFNQNDNEQDSDNIQNIDQFLNQIDQQLICSQKNNKEKTEKKQKVQQNLVQNDESDSDIDIEALLDQEEDDFDLQNLEDDYRKYQIIAGLSSETIQDKFTQIKHLLKIFGVPYVEAPSEAEAQCAHLEQLGLVDGTITDDSDSFLFGSQKVYRGVFSTLQSDQNNFRKKRKNVPFLQYYSMKNIDNTLGLNRDQLQLIALFLGSDYTIGIKGVGIVNALEIVQAFEDLESLNRLKEWGQSADILLDNAEQFYENIPLNQKLFLEKHKNYKKQWELPPDFPSKKVINAYNNPLVDKSDEQFTWQDPDLGLLHAFCTETMEFQRDATDLFIQQIKDAVKKNKMVQPKITEFFGKEEKFAVINSKRMLEAVQGIKNKALKINKRDEGNINTEHFLERIVENKSSKKKSKSQREGEDYDDDESEGVRGDIFEQFQFKKKKNNKKKLKLK